MLASPIRRGLPILLLLWIASSVWAGDWATYQANARRTGNSGANHSPTELKFLWQAPTDYAGAKIVGDTIVATKWGFDGSHITAFHARTGQVLWDRSFGSEVISPPTIDGNYVSFVYGPQSMATVELVRLSDGSTLAASNSNDSSFSPPLLLDNGNGTADLVLATSGGVRRLHYDGTGFVSKWSAIASLGGFVSPSRIGSSIILAGVGQYYAVEFETGQLNHFHSGNISGGGGGAAVIDSANQRIFIREMVSSEIFDALSAYSFAGQNAISQLWQIDTAGFGSDPALTSEGDVVFEDNGVLWLRDGETGALLDNTANLGIFDQAPMITSGRVWVGASDSIRAYDLATLEFQGSLSATLRGGNTGEMNFSAASDAYLLTQSPFGGGFGAEGFRVYGAVPEPLTALAIVVGISGLIRRQRQ